jgi:hypothetical protein
LRIAITAHFKLLLRAGKQKVKQETRVLKGKVKMGKRPTSFYKKKQVFPLYLSIIKLKLSRAMNIKVLILIA